MHEFRSIEIISNQCRLICLLGMVLVSTLVEAKQPPQVVIDTTPLVEWPRHGPFGKYRLAIDSLSDPASLAVLRDGMIVIVERAMHRLRVVDVDGNVLREWGTLGSEPGELRAPGGIAIDDRQHLYVSDSGNHRIQVFDSSGKFLHAFSSHGKAPGQLIDPGGIVVHHEQVYIADSGNHRIQVYSSDGQYQFGFGEHGSGDG